MKHYGTPFERFDAQTEKSGDCVVWVGLRFMNGYGLFFLGGKGLRAHRFAYERENGPIPVALTIDHLCRNRACVKVEHLEAVTLTENVRRGNGVSARNARKTNCVHGHLLPGAKREGPNGPIKRRCVVCRRTRANARYHRLNDWIPGKDRRKAECFRGHLLTPENRGAPEKRHPSGRCIQCRRIRVRARYHARKMEVA